LSFHTLHKTIVLIGIPLHLARLGTIGMRQPAFQSDPGWLA
jgi:hypothetical protein